MHDARSQQLLKAREEPVNRTGSGIIGLHEEPVDLRLLLDRREVDIAGPHHPFPPPAAGRYGLPPGAQPPGAAPPDQRRLHAPLPTRRPRHTSRARAHCMPTSFQVAGMRERPKARSGDHFETHPDGINWGDVGNLNHYASLLRQITDIAFKEGEHAA